MMTAIVRFPLPAGTSLEEAKTLFEGSAPKYQDLPGLVRKYYLYDDGPTGGGVSPAAAPPARPAAQFRRAARAGPG